METLLWGLVCLFGVAALADKVMTEEAVLAWRERTRKLRDRVEQMDVDAATAEAHEWFVGLFDAIYDVRFWSLRRFGRSALAGGFALGIVVLMLGWGGTIFVTTFEKGRFVGVDEMFLWLSVVLFPIVFNLIADYFSLQETRWVLGTVRRGANLTAILFWVLVDLFLSLLIFYLALAMIFTGWFWFDRLYLMLEVEYFPMFYEWFFVRTFTVRGFLPFLLTTFFTSALWISYVITALGVRAVRRNSRVLRAVLGTIAESRARARATAGFLAGFLALGYGLVAAVAWTVG